MSDKGSHSLVLALYGMKQLRKKYIFTPVIGSSVPTLTFWGKYHLHRRMYVIHILLCQATETVLRDNHIVCVSLNVQRLSFRS